MHRPTRKHTHTHAHTQDTRQSTILSVRVNDTVGPFRFTDDVVVAKDGKMYYTDATDLGIELDVHGVCVWIFGSQ